jgi:Flp pilus assembly protein TadG
MRGVRSYLRFGAPWRRNGGVAAIEFAIVAPMLLALVIASVELGFATQASIQSQDAAAAGAFYATQKGWDAAGISAAVLAATSAPGLTAAPAPQLYCGCPTTTGIGSTTCGVTCADGVTARQYVKVSASLPRKTVIGSGFGLPGTVTSTSTARLP